MTDNVPAMSLDQLSTTLYEHLKVRGVGMMKSERSGHTLTPTALVHEAFARLAVTGQGQFNDRAHLLAAAALAMRRILVEHARARGRIRRGGGRGRVEWDAVVASVAEQNDPDLMLSLDEALEKIRTGEGELGPRYARMVELRLFGAMTNEEIAAVLGVSLGTVEKDWKFVRAKVQGMLSG